MPKLSRMTWGAVAGAALMAGIMPVPAFGQAAGETAQQSADALFAKQKWSEAEAAYRALLARDAKNGQNWYRLARAEHQQKNFAGARDAYLKALETGFSAAPRARFGLARAYMSLQDSGNALQQLEAIAKVGTKVGRRMASAAEFQPLKELPRFQAAVKATTPCTADVYRGFDFWHGKWDVTRAGASAPTATSHIQSVQQGCGMLEHYIAGTYNGRSINFYDNVRKVWHQSWIDNTGGVVYIEGNVNAAGEMVLSDADHPISKAAGTINKVTWSPLPDGRVRQHWQNSGDGGKSWTTSFDGYYKRKTEEAAQK